MFCGFKENSGANSRQNRAEYGLLAGMARATLASVMKIVRVFFSFFFALALLSVPVVAQPVMDARPVESVAAEPLPGGNGPIVLELFTARSCIFCPQADRLFADLVTQPNVIGIACHVDYFATQDPMARRFCIDRQNWYMNRLRAGPSYTPQMVVNGARDVIGYRRDQVMQTVQAVSATGLKDVAIEPQADATDNYLVRLDPALVDLGLDTLELVVMTFQNDTSRKLHFGAEKGTSVTYARAADGISTLPLEKGQSGTYRLTIPLSDKQRGLTVFVQKKDSGEMVAAGEYIRDVEPAGTSPRPAAP